MKGIIIGGGVTGLLTASLLQRKGIETYIIDENLTVDRLLSQAQGQGYWIAPNGMAIIRKVHPQLEDDIFDVGKILQTLSISDTQDNKIHQTEYVDLMTQYGFGFMAIQASEWIQILLRYIKPNSLVLRHKLKQIICHDNFVTAYMEDGSEISADFLLGCEGALSATRNFIHKKVTPKAGTPLRHLLNSWQGVCNMILPPEISDNRIEIWEQKTGLHIAFSQISSTKVFFVASAYITPNDKLPTPIEKDASTKEYLHEQYRNFSPVFHEILQIIPSNQIYYKAVYDLPHLERWSYDRVALVGESAHISNPMVLQNISQNLESIWALVQLLDSSLHTSEIPKLFKSYQQSRKTRSQMVIDLGYRLHQNLIPKKGMVQAIKKAFTNTKPAYLSASECSELWKAK